MEENHVDTVQVHPVIGETLTPDQVAYVAKIVDEIAKKKGHGVFTADYIETIVLDPHAFEAAGQDFLQKTEIIYQHILVGEAGMALEMVGQFEEQQDLRDELHESLFKSVVLAEHAQKRCEQALQSAVAEYSDEYRAIMQARMVEHSQQIMILKGQIDKFEGSDVI